MRFFRKKRYRLLLLLAVAFVVCAIPELVHRNEGESRVSGSVGGGSLENGWLLPWSGPNFRYFSPLSYFVLDRGYVHDNVYRTITDAYAICAETCPGKRFVLMECSREEGGRMWPHWTHQTGLSADFMVPKVRSASAQYGPERAGAGFDGTAGTNQFRLLDHLGVWHYLLDFDDQGQLAAGVGIDFETLGRHLLALDDAGRRHGLAIKKVILRIELKDNLFATPAGKELRRRGIYFARALPPLINDLHDDHYHVDFTFR